MQELNVGIVGLGWVASAHINAFKTIPNVNVSAVCSRRAWDAQDLKDQFGITAQSFTSYSEMLAQEDLDIIDICTPHFLHTEQAIAAARAGKHIILEKPIALTLDELNTLEDEITKAKVHTCVCFELRFSDQLNLTKSIIDQGIIGDVHFAEVDYYQGIGPENHQYPWNIKRELGGSSLITAGCHAMDGLLYYIDSPAVEVSTYASQSNSPDFIPYEYPTTSVTIVKFLNGSVGKVTSCIDARQPYYYHTHIVGSQGSILDNKLTSTKLSGLNLDKWSTLETKLIESGDVHDHPYVPQFQSFVESVRQGKDMPRTDIKDAIHTHRICLAADRSIKESRAIRLSEMYKA